MTQNDDIYYHKYLVYKKKYLELKQSLVQSGGGGGKFTCNPAQSFNNICYEDSKGFYNSKEKCINDCQFKYINKHLIDARLKNETSMVSQLIKNLMDLNIDIYIKGGTVLGLKILQMIYEKYPDKNFEKYFNEFLKVGLIRDWDFACYTNGRPIDDKFRKQTDKIARKCKMVPAAKTFILYQFRGGMKIDDQVLFELSILEDDDFVNLELPLTTMKVKVKHHNLQHIFMLAKCFHSYRTKQLPIDLDLIKHIIKDMKIIIPEHRKGLFIFDQLYTGNLSKPLLKLIKDFTRDVQLQQFLISQISEPHRMFFRLFEKNIPKVKKINIFLDETRLVSQKPSWLFDAKYINTQAELFIEQLGSLIYKKYNECLHNKLNTTQTVVRLDELLEGINLKRLINEYKNFECRGKDMIKILFERVHREIITNRDALVKLQKNNLALLFLFLDKQHLFNKTILD